MVGMITEAYISERLLNFPMNQVDIIKKVLLKIYGKNSMSEADYKGITTLLIHDKKNVGGKVNFVLLNAFESFELDCEVGKELVIDALDYYMR